MEARATHHGSTAPPAAASTDTPVDGEPSDAPPVAQNAFPIVGVGASAGGLDALKQLLTALPGNTGMAYVLVQHLDPRHQSIMAELLAKTTPVSVSEVKGDTRIEPDHVYVAPAQQDVTIEGGMLKLVPRGMTRGQHMPIDSFLRALAEAQATAAMGVILSGTGADGTLGLQAVKARGGITIAQDPGSAAYDGMPRSAISSGCVDFVLAPSEIARELSRLGAHPYVLTPARAPQAREAAPRRREDALKRILALVRGATGSDFGSYKEATIRRRIARRMALVQVEGLDAYARYLEEHPDEVRALHQDCLITVSSFFREPDAFQALSERVLPHLLKDRPPDAHIRVWVPGCGTGEEAYSIVISVLEAAGELKGNPSLQLFATDLSEAALEKARAGIYPESIAQDVSPARLERFFTKVDGCYRVGKALRDMCVFARHDLTRDPPFSRLDLISCRNLLIYLEPRLQQRVLAVFHYALLPAGFLLLGGSETAAASPNLFAPVDPEHRIYSRRATDAPTFLGFTRGRQAGESGGGRRHTGPAAIPEDAAKEADRVLLARYAPPGVVVDEKDDIVEFRGQTDAYLEHGHGRASLNLFRMARKGLALPLRTAVAEARKRGAAVRREGLTLRDAGRLRRFDLQVVPLGRTAEKEHPLLVLFEARPERRNGRGGAAPPPRPAGNLDESEELRRELAEATQHLQTVTQEHGAAIEQLQAANEEVLSANEELQSINEELETAKEELQSVNEELTTLNQELQDRNLQLGRALEFAGAVVETVHNPLLVLDAGVRVESANPAFYETFRVTPEETLGRHVFELGTGQWDIPPVRLALDEMLRRGGRFEDHDVEHEFPRIGRRTFVLNARRIRPDGGPERILLAFEDRTETRRVEAERQALFVDEQDARARAELADHIKDEFVATVSHELRGPLTAMVGWIHILRAATLDEATRERGMAALERSIRAQTRLIEDLLDHARLAMGKLSLSQRLTDLVVIAQAVMAAIQSAADAKAIRIELVSAEPMAMVLGDPDRLQQVLWNLLSNAVKFTPRGGRVKIWVGRVGAHVEVRVNDTGQGIPPGFLPYVFDRFRQADGAASRTRGGLGLGLAIVKQLVELHGGTVQADSPGEGRGATFTVSIPIPALLREPKELGEENLLLEAPRSRVAWEELNPRMLEGVRVLVVEDEADAREMLVTALEHCGAKVLTASSAGEALETLAVETPDVLVSDVGLPGGDGYALMEKVRTLATTKDGRIPALALTAFAGPDDRRRAAAAGFDVNVPKPADPGELIAQVAALAGRERGNKVR